MDAMFLTSLLASEGEKHSAAALGVLIVLPLVLSFVLYRFAKSRVDLGGKRVLYWGSLVPLVAGAYLAIQPFSDISKQSYRDFYFISPRSAALHYATLVTPAVALLILTGVILYGYHRERMER